jgi:intracellular septation protein A
MIILFLRILLQNILIILLLTPVFHLIYEGVFSQLLQDSFAIQFRLTFQYFSFALIFYLIGKWNSFNNMYWRGVASFPYYLKKMYNSYILTFLVVGVLNIPVLFFLSLEYWVNFKTYSGLIFLIIPMCWTYYINKSRV